MGWGFPFLFLSRIWSFGCVFLYTLGVGGLGRITHTNVALSVYKLPFCIILYVLREARVMWVLSHFSSRDYVTQRKRI